VISTFNTYSRGPTHWYLTDIGGGYNFGVAGLPHHTPQPSQPTVLHFPPKGSVRSQVNHPTIIKELEGINPKSHEWESLLDFCYNLTSNHSMTNDKPPRDRVNKANLKG
jgi:hypothetical protein